MDLDAVEGEGQLHIHRLLDPQRAVIVEGRDALLGRNEIRPALRRDARDKIEDRSLRRALVPGRQRIACACATADVERSEAESMAASPAPTAGRGGRCGEVDDRFHVRLLSDCTDNAGVQLLAGRLLVSFSIACSTEKEPRPLPRRKLLEAHQVLATIACAGTSTKACSTNHLT